MKSKIQCSLLATCVGLGYGGGGCGDGVQVDPPNTKLTVTPQSIDAAVNELFSVTVETDGRSASFDPSDPSVISTIQAVYRESGGELVPDDYQYSIAEDATDPSRVRVYFVCQKDGITEVDVSGSGVLASDKFTVTCGSPPQKNWAAAAIVQAVLFYNGVLPAGDMLNEVEENQETVDDGDAMDHQGGSRPQRDDHTTTCSTAVIRVEDADPVMQATRAFGLTTEVDPIPQFPCGEGPNGITLCPAGEPALPDAPMVVAAHALMSEIPLDSPDRHFQFGFVFDSDGDPSNNFVPLPQFAGDFFQDTDLWFVASYTPTDGWELQTSRANGGDVLSVSINARIVISGNALVLFAPADAFDSPEPAYRVTAFEHDGTWQQDPNWAGDVEPPVDQGLRPFDVDDR